MAAAAAAPTSPTQGGYAAAEWSLENDSEGSDTPRSTSSPQGSCSPPKVRSPQRGMSPAGDISRLSGSSIQQLDPLAQGRGQAVSLSAFHPRGADEVSRSVSAAWLLEAVAAELCRPGSSSEDPRHADLMGRGGGRAAGGGSVSVVAPAGRALQRAGPLIRLPLNASHRVPFSAILQQLEGLFEGVEIRVPFNWVGLLPRELLLHTLSFLPSDDARVADKVCVEWRGLCSTPLIWRNLSVAMWPRFSEERERELDVCDLSEVDGVPRAAGPAKASAEFPVEQQRQLYWRRAFNRKTRRERAWLSRRSAAHRFPCLTVVTQTNGIHCVQFDDTDLLTGSGTSNEIGVWDMAQLQRAGGPGNHRQGPKGTLTGHHSAVTCLQFDSQQVLSGSLDSTVRLWGRQDYNCQRVFEGHSDKVWCVQFLADRVVSGSSDKMVKIWNLHTGECLTSLKDHRTSVSCVRMDDRIVVSGSAGNSIRVWDVGDGAPVCISKLRGHQKGVFCLQFDNAKIVSGSLDNTIRVWDRRDGFKCVRMITSDRPQSTGGGPDEANRGIICFAYDDTKIVSGGADNLIKVWDMRKWELVHSLTGHSHWITSLQFDDHKIVTGSRDKSVKLWNITDLASTQPPLQPACPAQVRPALSRPTH